MRRLALLSVAASFAVGIVASATAADMPVRNYSKAPAMVPVYNWSGFYLGAQVGYQWGQNREDAFVTATRAPLGSTGWDSDGVVGGGHIGYNWMIAPNWLIGLEGDFEGSGVQGGFQLPGGGTRFSQDWQGSVRGRLGFVAGTALIYATGGAAFSDLDTRHTNAAGVSLAGDRFSSTEVGYTVGAGVEWMVAPSWTVRGEYRYTDYGRYGTDINPTSFPTSSFAQHVDFHTVRAGVSYYFGR